MMMTCVCTEMIPVTARSYLCVDPPVAPGGTDRQPATEVGEGVQVCTVPTEKVP